MELYYAEMAEHGMAIIYANDPQEARALLARETAGVDVVIPITPIDGPAVCFLSDEGVTRICDPDQNSALVAWFSHSYYGGPAK